MLQMRILLILITQSFIVLSVLSASADAQLPELIGVIKSDTTNALFGLKLIAVGDQNGDDKSDIMVWYYRFQWELFWGGQPVDNTPDLYFRPAYGRGNLVGDINGDGIGDIGIPFGTEYEKKTAIFFGGTLLDTFPDLVLGVDSIYAAGYATHCEDINSNGTDDLISYVGAFRPVLLFELGDDSDSIPDLHLYPANLHDPFQYVVFGESIITGDFNGDGKRDIGVNLRPSERDSLNGSIYFYWGGSDFDTIPDMIIERPGDFAEGQSRFGKISTGLGDFSGDGYDDFFAASAGSDSLSFIFFGGPSIDSVPDITIVDDISIAKPAGDLNNDGYQDLITSFPLPWSGGGWINVYFGGPDADSISDIRIYNWQDPKYQTEFGMDCVGLGDFNGDGVDDFAFSAVQSNHGEVYIYSGVDQTTSVDDETKGLPEDFVLHQNYPNPFNPSTTIQFTLQRRSDVTLKIYNILGVEIKTLLERSVPAGQHVISWDGRNRSGESVASGVYFYKLTTEGSTATRKMVLLK